MKGKIKKIVIAIIVLIIGAIGLYFWGFINSNFENKNLRKELISDTMSQEIDLDLDKYPELPEPVRKYFEYTFNGQKSIKVKYVFWKEKGKFKLPVSTEYFRISSAQTSITTEPKYLWEGLYMNKTFRIPILESRDSFSIDKHNMRAKAFGQKVVMSTNYTDEQMNSLYSYLMLRYYGTALDFPWALLPSEFVKWEAKDEKHAYLEIAYKDLKGKYLATFNDKYEIIKLETEGFMLHGNEDMLREVGKKSEYKEINGFIVPTHMDYTWYEEDGSVNSHYVFDISQLEYN